MRTAHVDPEEAVRAAEDLHARCAIGIHWGTFPLTDEPMDEPPRRLRVALEAKDISSERFFTLKRGETRKLSGCVVA